MSLGTHASYIRARIKFGDAIMMQNDGLTDAFLGVAMGITAENVVKKYNVTREEQDEFAFQSHKKAAGATNKGHFKNEIVPLEIRAKKELKK